jgi:hypothetical protein
MPDPLQRMRRGALRAHLLILGQIVLDGDARKMLRDRLASPGMFFLVRFDLCGALLMGLIRCGNRGQHLGLVEQHRLIGINGGGVLLLGDRAEVLRLDPAQLLLQQHHPLAVARALGPQLFHFLLQRFELTRALRGDALGKLQPSVQLSILTEDLLRGSGAGGHGAVLYCAHRAFQHTLNSRA